MKLRLHLTPMRYRAFLVCVGMFILLVSLCGYAALYTYIVMHSFNFPGLIAFINPAAYLHLLPFVGGAILTLFLAGMAIKCLINPWIRHQYRSALKDGSLCRGMIPSCERNFDDIDGFLDVWEITRSYWQNRANQSPSLSGIIQPDRDLLFSVWTDLQTWIGKNKQTAQQAEVYWSRCLTDLFEDGMLTEETKKQKKQLLERPWTEEHCFSKLSSLPLFVMARKEERCDLLTPLFKNAFIMNNVREEEIIVLLRRYSLSETQSQALRQAIFSLKDPDKKARLIVTAMLSGHLFEKDMHLIPPSFFVSLCQPLTYHIDMKNQRWYPWCIYGRREKPNDGSFNKQAIEVSLTAIRDSQNKPINESVFAQQTLSVFFANLINASRNDAQIQVIRDVIQNYIATYLPQKTHSKKDRSALVVAILQRVDFYAFLGCETAKDRVCVLGQLIGIAKDHALLSEQLQAGLQRLASKDEKRQRGTCFLDVMVEAYYSRGSCHGSLNKEHRRVDLPLIIEKIFTPLEAYGGFTLIHALLKERAQYTVICDRPDGIMWYTFSFDQLLQYAMDCFERAKMEKEEKIAQLSALIKVQFLTAFERKVGDNCHELIWQQCLQSIDRQLGRLAGDDYHKKAQLVEKLYKGISFTQEESRYQAILEKQQCCIRLNQMINKANNKVSASEAVKHAFEKAARGTLSDIYHVLSTYWNCLCQQNQETQTQWLCLLLGAENEKALPACLTQRLLIQSGDQALNARLLRLLFKVPKEDTTLESEEKGPSSSLSPSCLNTKTIGALLIGRGNIYTDPDYMRGGYQLMQGFNAKWDSTQPWLSQQSSAIRQRVVGIKLLVLLIEWADTCFLCIDKKVDRFCDQVDAMLTRLFSEKYDEAVLAPAILIASASSKLSGVFNGYKWKYHASFILPLLTHLLPFVMETLTDEDDDDDQLTLPIWLPPGFLNQWINQSTKELKKDPSGTLSKQRALLKPWGKLITTMANRCPSVLFSELGMVKNSNYRLGAMAYDGGKNINAVFFIPIVTTLWRLSQQEEQEEEQKAEKSVPQTAYALLMDPVTQGYLLHALLHETAQKNKESTPLWEVFILKGPADFLFQNCTVHVSETLHENNQARFRQAVPKLITLFNENFFKEEEKDDEEEETSTQPEKAAYFLVKLCHLIPNDNEKRAEQAVNVLFDAVVRQLEKIKRTDVADPLMAAFILTMEAESQQYNAYFIQSAKKWWGRCKYNKKALPNTHTVQHNGNISTITENAGTHEDTPPLDDKAIPHEVETGDKQLPLNSWLSSRH